MAYRLPVAAFADAVQAHGDATALISGDERWSYDRLGSAVAAVPGPREGGPAPGSRVRIAPVPGEPATVARLWAAWWHGLVVVCGDDVGGDASQAAVSTRAPSNGMPPAEDASPADDMCLVPTSGSTGPPKLVRLTHANVAAAVAASRQRLGNEPGDTWLLCLPLTHVAGLSVLWRAVEAVGSVLLQPGFDPTAAAVALRSGDVEWASLVPTMLARLLDADPGPYPRSIRGVLVGGAPASADLVTRGLDAGLPILATYGLTEACSQVATVAPEEARASLGTAGLPLPGMTVEIAPGAPSAPEVGRIVVSGPAVSPGYADESPRSGAFVTGDLGRFDTRGRLIVVGRADDVIITGGENVVPAVVEEALLSCPGVRAAAVYALADEDWGEVVAAAVVAPGVDPARITGHAREHMRPFEVPKRWLWLDELPLLPGGKVDVAALAARHSPA